MYFSLHIVDNLDFVSYRLNTQAVMASEVGKDPGLNSQWLIDHFILSETTKHAGKGIEPGFETQDRCHLKSKTGASVVQQKELISSKKLSKRKTLSPEYI